MLSSLDTKHFYGHRKSVSAVAWNLNGSRLAAGGDNSAILIWDTDTFESGSRHERRWIYECRGHTNNIEVVLASPTSPDIFASAGLDCRVNLYDVRTGPNPTVSITTDSTCLFGEWGPDGNSIAIGSSTNNLYLIDCLSQRVTKKIPFDGEVNQFRWSKDGKRLHLTRGEGCVDVYEWPSMKMITALRGHSNSCMGIACDPLGRFVAVTSLDTCVSTWDATSLTNMFTIDRWETAVQQAEYSFDGKYLALMGDSHYIEITDSSTGTSWYSIPTASKVNYMAWHPRRNLLAYTPAAPRYPTADYQPATCVWGLGRG